MGVIRQKYQKTLKNVRSQLIVKQHGTRYAGVKATQKTKEISPEQKMWKELALASYDYSNHDQLDSKLRQYDYEVDRELSHKNATVLRHRNSNHAVVSYRGTDPSNFDDLLADKHIATGSRKHKRFDEAVDLAKRAKAKYGDIKVTGHSLGGTQALHVNRELGFDAHAFNPGSAAVRGHGADYYAQKNARIYKNPNDLIARNVQHMTADNIVEHRHEGAGSVFNYTNPLLYAYAQHKI